MNSDDTLLLHPEHINVLIWAGLWLGKSRDHGLEWSYRDHNGTWHTAQLTRATADRVGQMLVDANAAAVNRIHGTDGLYVYSWRPPRRHEWSLVEILKAIDYYEWQGAQNHDWGWSEPFAFCFALRAGVVAQLPGYSHAAWHITDTTTPSQH